MKCSDLCRNFIFATPLLIVFPRKITMVFDPTCTPMCFRVGNITFVKIWTFHLILNKTLFWILIIYSNPIPGTGDFIHDSFVYIWIFQIIPSKNNLSITPNLMRWGLERRLFVQIRTFKVFCSKTTFEEIYPKSPNLKRFEVPYMIFLCRYIM